MVQQPANCTNFRINHANKRAALEEKTAQERAAPQEKAATLKTAAQEEAATVERAASDPATSARAIAGVPDCPFAAAVLLAEECGATLPVENLSRGGVL